MEKQTKAEPSEGFPPFSDNTPNKINRWHSTDSKQRFTANWKNPTIRRRLIALGYDENSITYNSDKHGMRNPLDIDWHNVDGMIMSLGCSYTYGVGLKEEEIWASVLAKKLDRPLFNAGVPGGSSDNAFRIARTLIPKYKPYAVFHLVTHDCRTEIISDETLDKGYAWQYGPWNFQDKKFQEYTRYVTNEMSLKLQQERNRLAIAQMCHLNDVIYVDWRFDEGKDVLDIKSSKSDDRGRDLDHPGREHQRAIACKMHELYCKNIRKNT